MCQLSLVTPLGVNSEETDPVSVSCSPSWCREGINLWAHVAHTELRIVTELDSVNKTKGNIRQHRAAMTEHSEGIVGNTVTL